MATTNTESNISALMEQQTTEPADDFLQPGSTTNFTNDGSNIATAKVHDPVDLGKMFNANLSIYQQQDVKEFLRKPVKIASGTFSTTDTTSGVKFAIDPYVALMTNDMVWQKIKGNLAMRAKVVVRLVINANRFQQGRYFLAFFPTCGAESATQSVPWFNLHCATLTQRTQLPKVEFDLNRDTEAVFEVPFLSSYSHLLIREAADHIRSPGFLNLCCYSPLVAPTGSTIANYTMYAHFEDVDIQTPTVPQARVNFKSSTGRSKSKGNDHQADEQAQANLGPISSTLSKVSKAADIVARVPLLSSIAAPVSWFADIASDVASVFGWSNPLDLSEVTRAIQTIIPYANNVDMPDAAMPLSLYARNTIEVLPGLGGTDIDEMSIDYLKTIPAWLETHQFSTTDSEGELKISIGCIPDGFDNVIVDNGRTIRAHTPISYLSKFFKYYRGGMIFKFKLVSTEFHSGRYAVQFIPYDDKYSVSLGDYSTTSYLHREIIDVRDGCEFTFHVPYTSISPYLETGRGFGAITVRCVNPLVAPASVSSHIDVLVEVCAAPDFELAALRTNDITLASPSAPQSKVSFSSNVNEIASGSIGGSQLTEDNCIASRHCIGEKVMSVLSVLKHNNPIVPTTQGTTAASALIQPFSINTYAYVGAVNNDSPYKSDLYSMFSSMYALSRGSVRWKVFNNAAVEVNTVEQTSASVKYGSGSTVIRFIDEYTTPIAVSRWLLRVIQNSIYRGCVDVQTPPYHFTFARNNVNELSGSGTSFYKTMTDATANPIQLAVNTATANGNVYYRQAADDFQLSVFISTPCTYGA